MKEVIISDTHGFLDEMIIVLNDLNLVNEEGKWIGGDTKIKHLGDMVDRGPKSLETYKYLLNLQEELGEDQVEILLGNHDIQYIGGPLAGLDYSFEKELSKIMKEDALAGRVKFATTSRDGEGREWLLVHGGLAPGYVDMHDKTPQRAAEIINHLGLDFVKHNTPHSVITDVGWQRSQEGYALSDMIKQVISMTEDLTPEEKVSISNLSPLRALKQLELREFELVGFSSEYFKRLGISENPGVTWCDVEDDLLHAPENIIPQIVGHRQQMDGIARRHKNIWAVNVPYGQAQALCLDENGIWQTSRRYLGKNIGLSYDGYKPEKPLLTETNQNKEIDQNQIIQDVSYGVDDYHNRI